MSGEADWIEAAISQARQQIPAAPANVWMEIEKHLKGKLSDRQLTFTERQELSQFLIALVKPPSKEEVSR